MPHGATRPARHRSRQRHSQPGSIPGRLTSPALRVLIGASVYREPAGRNALLFQIGQADTAAAPAPGEAVAGPAEPGQAGPGQAEPGQAAAGRAEPAIREADPGAAAGPVPPFHVPPGLTDLISECEQAGLMVVHRFGRGTAVDTDIPPVFVDRQIANALHHDMAAALRGDEIIGAHQHAAEYWQWRAAAWPQDRRADLHDLLEARYHLREAGDSDRAGALTEIVCAQLHAWGELDHEAALVQETLAWLPPDSPLRAAWIHEIGKIAQTRGNLIEAERRYQQSLEMFADAGDAAAASRSQHRLGILAQARGNYAEAEHHYRESRDLTREQASADRGRPGWPGGPPGWTVLPESAIDADLAAAPNEANEANEAELANEADGINRADGINGAEDSVEASGAGLANEASGAGLAGDAEEAARALEAGPAAEARRGAATDRASEASWRAGAGPGEGPPTPGLPGELLPGELLACERRPGARLRRPRHQAGTGGKRIARLSLLSSVLAIATGLVGLSAAGIIQVTPYYAHGVPSGPAKFHPGTAAALHPRAAAVVRRRAAGWLVSEVSQSAIMSCDPAMCTALRTMGWPAANLLTLGPSAQDPLGSDVVVATAAVRSLFGSRLAAVYAPAVVADFGLGKTRIQVRVVASDGAVAYRNAFRADLLARKTAGAQLLRNKLIGIGQAAQQQLISGQVDARLLTTLAALAHQHPLRIVGFSDSGPGAAPGTPLRSAEITAQVVKTSSGAAATPAPAGAPGPAGSTTAGSTTGGHPAASRADARFIRSALLFLHAQRPPYLAARLRTVMVGGREAVQIRFAGPSPLGLLTAGGSSTDTSP